MTQVEQVEAQLATLTRLAGELRAQVPAETQADGDEEGEQK